VTYGGTPMGAPPVSTYFGPPTRAAAHALGPADGPRGRSLPATGGATPVVLAAVGLVLGLGVRRAALGARGTG
jgi:LPXTG-motif cell wall-anchored protein